MEFGLNKFVSARDWHLNETPIETRPVLLRHVAVGRIALAMGSERLRREPDWLCFMSPTDSVQERAGA